MKKIIPLAVAVASASAAMAQENVAPDRLEHVLVTVPVHKTAAETALPVTVLTGEELRRLAANTIGETLAFSPGLANASFGPNVGQAVIRGQAGPRVTVLQNGTRSADVSNVSADHAVSVEPLLADSIEVLRGPSTLLYGGGTIGGVVNVLDNRIPVNAVDGVQGGAQYHHDTASSGDNILGRLEAGNGTFSLHLDGLARSWDNVEIPGQAIREEDHEEDHDEDEGHEEEAEGTPGIIENSDGETTMFTIGGAYHFDKGFFGLAVNRLENEYGIPPGGHGHHDEHDDEHDDEDHDDHDEEHEDDHDEDHDEEHGEEEEEENIRLDIEQTRYDAALHVDQPFRGADAFRGFLTYTDYEHVELEGDEIGTRYSNESWETRLELVHTPWGNAHGSFGLQASSGDFEAVGEEAFIPLTSSSEFGLFLVEDYHEDDLTLEGGLRYDRVERDPDAELSGKKTFDAFSVSGSAMYQVADQWTVGFALMHSQRAPAIEELFSNVDNVDPEDWVVHAATRSIELGNPDLDVERSNNFDLSVSWVTGEHFVTLNGFYNNVDDYIALINTGLEVDETPVYAYTNDDAKFYGLELDSEFTLAQVGPGALRLGVTGDMIRGKLKNDGDVPRLPPRRLGLKLSWASDSWYIYGRVLDADDQDSPGFNEEETAGYTRWDAGVDYRLTFGGDSEVVLFAKGKNLTDEEIRLSTSFLRDFAPEPGRSLEAGVRVVF